MERLWLHGNSKSLSNPQPFYFSRNEKYVQLIFYKEKTKQTKLMLMSIHLYNNVNRS